MDDELLDIVTRDDAVIGTINRQDYPRLMQENLGYIRACDLFIVNSRNELFVPIRTANKTIAPNGYDFSAGGHVGAGETYEGALVREIEEELNLTITPSDLTLVAKTVYDDIRYIQALYLLRTDNTPAINPADFIAAEWLTIDQLEKSIDDGHPAKSKIKPGLALLRAYLSA